MSPALAHMQIEVDTHTHTILSGHGWSTIRENCEAANRFGMKGVCLTEHTPLITGPNTAMLIGNMRVIPSPLCGINVYKGAELDITPVPGQFGIPQKNIDKLEFAIASLHREGYPAGSTRAAYTAAHLAALEYGYVDVVGHCDRYSHPCDVEAIVLRCKDKNRLMEVNNNSLSNPVNRPDTLKIAALCKQHDVRIVVSSDAHICEDVGQVKKAMELLDEVEFPPELIVNLYEKDFAAYLQERRARLAQ